MKIEHINAMNRFALKHGRGWKNELSLAWMRAGYPASVDDKDKALLQQLRNSGGPSILTKFRPKQGGYGRLAFIKKDRMECFTVKRGGFVNAWRLVDAAGVDLVQPWLATRTDALETAATLNIFVVADPD